MASYKGVPTIRKRLVGSQLARLRKACGLSVEEAAAEMGVGAFTVRRQESGETAVSVADAKAYADIYQVEDGDARERLLNLAKHGRTRGWWTGFDRTVGPAAIDLADAEDLATGVKTWHPCVIPGLLQTREYSAAVIEVRRSLGEAEEVLAADGFLELRERRKEVLRREKPPHLWAIIGEAAILTEVGGKAVMDGQLRHLLNVAELPHVSIQMLPFSAGAHAGMSGPFMVMSFDATLDGGIVFLENAGGNAFSDDPLEARQRTDRFAHLQAQALSVAETRRYLLRAISAK
jgi:transcriptional regulator with XRE-family HTH domain